MTRYGYFLSSEEYDPASLVRQARMAQDAGFEALWISDHFHPWLDEQGQSGFVWSMIGAISQVTDLPITTAVTCPTTRIHPAIIAQAAATSSLLTGGKFSLGVGTGEALNEHVTGAPWPSAAERREMLEEAIEIMRKLFTGKQVSHQGMHYEVETARLYSVPDEPPPVYVSGFGPASARLAARTADGYISVAPEADMVKLYRDEGGGDKTVQGGFKGCWAPDDARARATMHRLWPNDFIPGESAQLLPLPRHFAQLSQLVTEDMITAPCGPDPGPYVETIRAYEEAGFDEVYLGQVGGRLEGAFEFLATEVLPRARGLRGGPAISPEEGWPGDSRAAALKSKVKTWAWTRAPLAIRRDIMPSVFDVLSTDHQEVKRMLAELETGPTGPSGADANQMELRKRMVEELIIEESKHEAVEEMYFWPTVREHLANGDELADTAIGQEQDAKQILNQLEKLDASQPEFEAVLVKFIRGARDHISYEENKVWPGLAATLSAQDAADLGAKLEQAKKTAPTRPHPGTPPKPGALKGAGPVAAAADKLRDVISGRGRD